MDVSLANSQSEKISQELVQQQHGCKFSWKSEWKNQSRNSKIS